MRMGRKRGCSSSLLPLLFAAGLGLTGAFMVPVKLMTRSAPGLKTTAPRTAGTDTSSNEFAPEPVDRSTKKDVGDIVREAVFDASDSIADAVQQMPDFMAKTNQTLLRLGDMVNEVDDKYFSKYLSFDTQMTYQDTLAAATTTIEKIVDGGVKAAGSAGNPNSDNDGDDEDGGEMKKTNTPGSSAGSEASEIASKLDEGISAGAKESVEAVGDATTDAKSEIKKTADQARKGVESKAKEVTDAGSSIGELDRPEEVDKVISEFQRSAVEYFKSSPSSTSGGAAEGVMAALPDEIQKMEKDLESLLEESNKAPRKLKKAKKTKLVETLAAMESSFPKDANPLDDPALDGQWTLVYSSSSRLLRRALKGVLASFFKTSGRKQVVDTRACKVLNACKARLRMTPWGLPVAKMGHYRPTTDRKVEVTMPETKRGGLRRLLPHFRPGKTQAEVTYLSRQWRICRIGGQMFAFRKVDAGS